MPNLNNHDEKIAKMLFSSVFPLYVAKIEKKGRNIEELYQVISWLTGYSKSQINKIIAQKASFETFFETAQIHPNASLIKGSICGYKIEEITNQLTLKTRYLDKLVDELAKGKKMDKILR